MRTITLILLFSSAALAAPKRPPRAPPPAPPPVVAPPPPRAPACTALVACLTDVETAFETGDFELAQRLVRQAEPLAKTPAEQARVLLLEGALDAQSLGLKTPAGAEAVRMKFKEARRLDGGASYLTIPAFARTDGLELAWNESAPPLPAAVTPPVVAVTPAPPATKRFPLASALLTSGLVVAVGAAVTMRLVAERESATASALPLDADRFRGWQQAAGLNTAAQATWMAGAALGVAALVTFFVWLAEVP
ncbi:MAG: hypothetical protein INH37_23220 [Myxococcaceae bacterium]|nr:hypothetical protein [Myxococcaceae bacterium]